MIPSGISANAGMSHPEGIIFPPFLKADAHPQVAQYLVCSDVQLTSDQISTIYHKRWNVEDYHKLLKQNASLEKSPTHTVCTQTNHLFASLCGFVKLELLKLSHHLNHFALKSSIYLRALQVAFDVFRQFQPVRLAA
jgi:hypothetical protein